MKWGLGKWAPRPTRLGLPVLRFLGRSLVSLVDPAPFPSDPGNPGFCSTPIPTTLLNSYRDTPHS